jgi:hypothetical protein
MEHKTMPFIPNHPLRAWEKLWLHLLPFAVALTVPQIIPGYFATSVVLSSCAVRQATVLKRGESFSVDQFQSRSFGSEVLQDVAAGEKFCDRFELSLSGTAAEVPDGAQLRLFNVTGKGEAYIHEPALTVVNGRWHTTKVDPGSNIREIRFVRVSDAASRVYSASASRGVWGANPPPDDVQTVASIRLKPVPVCAELDARKCTPSQSKE